MIGLSLRASLSILLALLVVSGAAAEDRPHPGGSAAGVTALLPPVATTSHTITLAGRTLSYTTEAGTLDLLGGDGAPIAKMFFVSDTLKAPADAKPRPITFVFNGGPGAASAYLQLGGIGPRILATGDNGGFLPPPQTLKDNPDTWLDMTDLVFVDPVGTGYSRAAGGKKDEDFWSVQSDATSVGAFIRLYLQDHGRMGSPITLVGESYGGFRAALLAKTLQEDVGISPSGIVMISPALEFSLIYPDEFAPLHWALTLPSLAAVNLARRGVTGDDFKRQLAEVQRYATTDYLTAITGGLASGGKTASQTVSRYTGLPLPLVQRHFARIPVNVFAKEYDRADRRRLSLYDGTIDVADIAPQSDRLETPDPVLDRSVPVVTSAFVDYVRNTLNYKTPVSYRLLNQEAAGHWDYGTSGRQQGYAGAMDDLQEARALNPDLRVLIAQGYTDLVTPFGAARYLINQLPPLAGARPIEMHVYPGGHMLYLRPDSRHDLKRDAANIYQDQP
ncbi:MAG: S10 family peptidase [Pararhizobium sp.]